MSGTPREELMRAIIHALDAGHTRPSITDLCAEAGVSRPTFYQQFGDVPSLIEAAAVERMQTTYEAVTAAHHEGEWKTVAPIVVRELVDGLIGHADFYRQVLAGPSAQSFHERVVDFLTHRLVSRSPLSELHDDGRAERFAMFFAAGTTWLLARWLRDGSPADSAATVSTEISDLLVSCITAARTDLNESR